MRSGREVVAIGFVAHRRRGIEELRYRRELRWREEHLRTDVRPLQGVVEPELLLDNAEAETVLRNLGPSHGNTPS